jgi:hypothetical protein
MSTTSLRGKRRRVVVSTEPEFSSVSAEGGENSSDRESHYKTLVRKRNERISIIPFLLWHFSPGDKIENCSAHRGDGKRFIVHADDKLSAFVELERVSRESLRFPNVE